MSSPNCAGFGRAALLVVSVAMTLGASRVAGAQSSPFLTGATALQTNIIAWLTPIAVILIMVLGGMAMANRIVENCGNTLILRCSGSEGGGTSHFASRLIGEREVVRRQITRGREREGLFTASSSRRSTQVSSQHVTEMALMPSELEQLPDLTGYLKLSSARTWIQVVISREHT